MNPQIYKSYAIKLDYSFSKVLFIRYDVGTEGYWEWREFYGYSNSKNQVRSVNMLPNWYTTMVF